MHAISRHYCAKCYVMGTFWDGSQQRFSDCSKQYQWNKKMVKLLAKEPKSLTGISFMPKGEVS